MIYLGEKDDEMIRFGIKGAFRVRAVDALPRIREIAESKLRIRSPRGTLVLSERKRWWTQYEALSVLAQWEKEKA